MSTLKHKVLAAVRGLLAAQVEAARASQKATVAGATHEESRPENDKDTRALEATYLARGQARRVMELDEGLQRLSALPSEGRPADAPIGLGALATLEDDHGTLIYFVAPAGGGLKLDIDGQRVVVVTPDAPVGRALLGRRVGDDVEIRTPQGVLSASVERID